MEHTNRIWGFVCDHIFEAAFFGLIIGGILGAFLLAPHIIYV